MRQGDSQGQPGARVVAGRTTAPSTATGPTRDDVHGRAPRVGERTGGVSRRARVAVLAGVAAVALTGCRVDGLPGDPGTPAPSPTAEPTVEPPTVPTTDPTDGTTDGTTNPGTALPPGASDGVDVSVEIEPAFLMPNVVEARLKQARADLEKRDVAAVVVVDARNPATGALRGAADGWTVCDQHPAAGDLVRASQTVTLGAAPNARQCP
jgi:hypothetical protein